MVHCADDLADPEGIAQLVRLATGPGVDRSRVLAMADSYVTDGNGQPTGVHVQRAVVVPALSWIATSEAITSVGGRPVSADISADTYTLDPSDFARRVTARTKAVIPVHVYGQPADMDPILAIARRHGLFMLEDCAQAHGARYRNRAVDTLGNAASFSFLSSKNLGAYGDAEGMVTNDNALAAHVRMLARHGQESGKHDHQIEGRNSRMDGLQGAVLSVKLAHLPRWTEASRAHASAYRRQLMWCPGSSGHYPRPPSN